MLTAAIAAPKISFDTVAMISFSADALLSARRYWIISPQIPSRFPEHDAELHCMRGAADCGEHCEVAGCRIGDICAREAGHDPGMINIVVNAAAKLSKLDTR
jgi:hypothetical protein